MKMKSDTDFIGRKALEAARRLQKRFAGFTLDEPEAVLVGRETILRNGEPVGYLTSGGYGHSIGKSIGYGYVRNASGVGEEFLNSGDYALVVALETYSAEITLSPLVDPENRRVKA